MPFALHENKEQIYYNNLIYQRLMHGLVQDMTNANSRCMGKVYGEVGMVKGIASLSKC